MDPIQLFNKWLEEELQLTKVRLPMACCLSSSGLDGYPNARFVSLKEVTKTELIVTGTLSSLKGLEVERSNKLALTFWWTETERQVRIQGDAVKISDKLADKYFTERNRDSQIVSIVSEQGKEVESMGKLMEKYDVLNQTYANKVLPRPENWGGYSIRPIRMEFLEFKTTRFHNRTLYERTNENWNVKQLQP